MGRRSGLTTGERALFVACGLLVVAGLWGVEWVRCVLPVLRATAFKTRTSAPEAAPKVRTGEQLCTEVDVVYLWVNGSEPEHRAQLARFGYEWEGGFRDYGVIKYSARSVAEFMPWVRNIIIVTNGQVPNWVDPTAPRFRLVTHSEVWRTHTQTSRSRFDGGNDKRSSKADI